MHPYLVRLGIPLTVQDFFAPYWRTDDAGALLFDYGDQQEHYGMAFHRIPVANTCWLAGTREPGLYQIFICDSAMEAICFLALHHYRFQDWNRLLFIATGGSLTPEKVAFIKSFASVPVSLIQENSLLGTITALKLAAALRRHPIVVFSMAGGKIKIIFRNGAYDFDVADFSLSRFEKASGYRFNIRCYQPKIHLTYLDQLKDNPFTPHL